MLPLYNGKLVICRDYKLKIHKTSTDKAPSAPEVQDSSIYFRWQVRGLL